MDYTNVPRHPVTSSNIGEVGYDEETQTLIIKFKRGGLYAYEGVPKHIYQELMDAPSVGSYFHTQIRPNYGFTH